MSSTARIITGTVIGAGIIAGVAYVKGLKKMQAELEIIPAAKLHKLAWNDITVKVDVLLKNPTASSFSIIFPYVKMAWKGNSIGTSQAVSKKINIPANGEAVIDNILIDIPTLNLAGNGVKIYKALQKGETITLTVKVMTRVDLGWKQFPYESTTDITLKK